jgi:hypothetical protein
LLQSEPRNHLFPRPEDRRSGGFDEVVGGLRGGCNEALQLCNDDLFAGGNLNVTQCSVTNLAPFLINISL